MSSEVIVEQAGYDPRLAAELGQLLVQLTDTVNGDPISDKKLRLVTESPTIGQFVARQGHRLVGAATLSQLGGLVPTSKAWLEDFVVAEDVRGQGVADAIADEWEDWCRERDVSTLMFTSGWAKVPAHKFYLRRGAFIVNPEGGKTVFFNYPIPELSK